MEHISQHAPLQQTRAETGNTGPLIIITTLFFMWGLLTALNDVLIPHLKALYTLSYGQAMLVQFCFFGAYFLVSLPAGALIRKIGYQNGAVTGLVVAAAGCALFYPASTRGYALFLFGFFVLAAGITILQVAANPYVTVLGDARAASSRLTLTQAFNSLGTAIAPALGGILILSASTLGVAELAQLAPAQQLVYRATQAASVQLPYLVLAAALLLLAVMFAFAWLPKIDHGNDAAPGLQKVSTRSVLAHPHLLMGTIGIFLYVGAEVSIGSFLINFFEEPQIAALTPATAARYVSYYWGGAMVGRFIGFAVMRFVSPGKALAFTAASAIALIAVAVLGRGPTAMWAILAVGLCNAIMFPTIFSMALYRLGKLTGQASGFLCMAIVGGAVVPFVQGLLADAIGLQRSFLVPAACYAFILFFGLKFSGLYQRDAVGPLSNGSNT